MPTCRLRSKAARCLVNGSIRLVLRELQDEQLPKSFFARDMSSGRHLIYDRQILRTEHSSYPRGG